MPIGPGLAKGRPPPLVVLRRAQLARSVDAGWRALFDAADTMSEGSVRDEVLGRVWYGTTSLILPLDPASPPGLRAFLAAFAAGDLHVRLRAVRAATREASMRAPSPLGSSACEIRVADDSRGVRIDVDVQAPLIESAARTKRR